jgi:hypothetical protein
MKKTFHTARTFLDFEAIQYTQDLELMEMERFINWSRAVLRSSLELPKNGKGTRIFRACK